MPEKPEPKISTGEVVVVGMFLLVLDAIDLIPIAGDLTDVAAAPLLLYYYTKHINGVAYAISCGLDLIPVVQEFPTRSLVWWGTVALDRFAPKKLEQVIETVGEAGEGGENAPAELESEGELGAGAANAGQQEALSAQEIQEQENLDVSESEATEEEVRQRERKTGEGQEPGQEQQGTEEEQRENGKTPEEQSEAEAEDIMAPESEKNPEKVEEKKLFEEVADNVPAGGTDEGDEEDEAQAPGGNVVGIDSSKRFQQNQQSPNKEATPFYDVKPKKKAA